MATANSLKKESMMSMGGGGSSNPNTPLPELFPGFRDMVGPALQDLFGQTGLNMPAVPNTVAPPVARWGDIGNVATQILDTSGGPTGTALSSLEEMSRTGAPTDTSASIAAREAIRQRMASEGSAQVAEQYGSRGQRMGSGIGLGTSDFLSKLDEGFAKQEADIGVASSEAAARRRMQASTVLPGVLPGAMGAAENVAGIEQQFAQLPLDAARMEALREQQGLQFWPQVAASVRPSGAGQQFGPSPIPGMLGGLGSLGSLFASPAGAGSSAASGIGSAVAGLFK